MALEASNFNQIRYACELNFIYNKKESEIIDAYNIMSIKIEKDDSLFLPVYGINLYLKNSSLKKLIANKDTVKVYLKLYKCTKTIYQNDFDLTKAYLSFNEVFVPIFDSTDLTSNDNLTNSTTSYNDEELATNVFDLYLFKEADLIASKKINNFVLNNSSVLDTIGLIATNCGIESILIHNPDNYKVHSQVFLPQLNLNNALMYLQDMYNIYKNGLITNLDLGTLYILKKDFTGNLPLYLDYENIYIHVLKVSNIDNVEGGYYKDTSSKCFRIKTTINNISFSNSESINSSLDGSTFKVIDNSALLSAASYNSETGKWSFGKVSSTMSTGSKSALSSTKYIDDLHSKNVSEITTELNKNSETANLFITNFDLAILKLNKKYNIIIEDNNTQKLYNKTYRPSNLACVLTRENSGLLSTSASIILVKI